MNAQDAVFRQAAWDMYASAALGMSMHPGTTRDAAKPLTMEQVAQRADELLRERDLRFGAPPSGYLGMLSNGGNR